MFEEGDIVLCTVEKIEPTVIFVKLDSGEHGTIVTSEIAPGRIKNMREYVAPNKRIVCKVLRNQNNHISLSLRRVTTKEKKEILEKTAQEQTITSALKQILKEDFEKVKEGILKDFERISDFIEKAKQDASLFEKYLSKAASDQIKKVLEKKKRKVEVKKNVHLKCLESDGIKRIKKLLEFENKNLSVNYISAGNFSIKIESENYKEANLIMQECIDSIEKNAKKLSCEFSCEK